MQKRHYNNGWAPDPIQPPHSYVHPVKANALAGVKAQAKLFALQLVCLLVAIFTVWFLFFAPKADAPSVQDRTQISPDAQVERRDNGVTQIPGARSADLSEEVELYAPSDMSDLFDRNGVPSCCTGMRQDQIHIAAVEPGNEVV